MNDLRVLFIRALGGRSYRELMDRIEDLADQCSVLRARLHPKETVTLEEAKRMLEEDADRAMEEQA